jgi:uncharacterized protein YndB with AHSA1/START domain
MDDLLDDRVRKQISVAVRAERAFRVFTEGMDLWWPPAHHLGASPLKQVVLEPRVGGRWYEIGEDGAQCEWGKVLVWEPPRRLVLAWQLDGDWRYDPSFVTEVAVTFHAESATSTRVELEHRNLDRYGDKRDAARKAFESPDGWQLGLDRFARAALDAQG